MKFFIRYLLAGSMIVPCAEASAQRTITGSVIEKTKGGEVALPGATVSVPGTTIGTVADDKGRFSLTLPDSNRTIVVSYTGFEADTVRPGSGNRPLVITLRQPRRLGEVVVESRRKTTEINMIDPIKTERIGERELLKAACCNLSESFETTPSVDVAFTDAVSGYKQIQMLGLAGPYTLITRENIPDVRGINAVTGLTFTPGTWIEGMQLSKGTGSVVNGYEGVAGQINVEWRKPFEDKESTWHLNLYQSTQGRTEANVVYRNELTEALSTNFFFHGRSNWLKLDQNNDGFLDQPLDKQLIVANRWFWFAPKGWEVQGGVKGSFTRNLGGQKEYDGGWEPLGRGPWGFELNMNRVEAWAKLGHMIPHKPGTSFGLQLAGVLHEQDALYGNREYDAKQKSFYANFIYQTIIGNTDHVLKLGGSTLIDDYRERLTAAEFSRMETVPGLFAEYAWTVGSGFNLVAGLRGDYHNLFGAFATPRLHIRFAPWEKTSIRASVGRAQRTANIIAEQMGHLASWRSFFIYGADSELPYGLKPEVAWNTGINLTQKFMLNYRDGSFSVDYYYTDFQNQVVVDIESPSSVRFYNLEGQSYAHSFQAQFDYELVRKLDVRLAYRFYDVRTTYNGELKMRPLVAPHRAFANVGYETRNKWKFDATAHWTGSKRVPSLTHHGTTAAAEYWSPAFWQFNAQISKTWKDRFEVYLGGENLANFMMHEPVRMASDPSSPGFDASVPWGPVMGRNIYAGLRYKIR